MRKINQILELHKADFPKTIKENQCDSIIEYRILNHLQKYLNEESRLIPQFDFELINHKFRVDFLLVNSQRKVVIECDGKEFHGEENSTLYDEWRDSLISQLGNVDVIYRFVFKDIIDDIGTIIEYLEKNEPTFFNNSHVNKEEIKISESCYNNRKWSNLNSINLIIHLNPKYLMNRDVVRDKMVLYSIIHKNKTIKYLIEEKVFSTEDSIENLIKEIQKKLPTTISDED